MPSKGIDVYSYISVPGYTVTFSVPEASLKQTQDQKFSRHRLDVDSSNIPGIRNYVGRFEWAVHSAAGAIVASRYNNINSLTGGIESGTMLSTQEFAPIVTDEVIITYCFYDAGDGLAGLPNRHQCYVTLCSTANAHWMADTAPAGTYAASLPFSRFVLAAPHDCGMNSMKTCSAIFSAADLDMIKQLKDCIPNVHLLSQISDEFLLGHLPDIVYGTAITQKKEISKMLTLGARYFEFRPAKLLPVFQHASGLPDKYYFQHAYIPGIAFDDFLDEVVTFLDTYNAEIVVVHVRYDNVIAQCKRPTNEELTKMFTEACGKAQHWPLKWGDRTYFLKSIDDLRQSGTRLIVVIEAEKYDSWTMEAYATLIPDPILARFASMDTEGQDSTDLTILQCQATPQIIEEVMIYSVLTAKAATSCLTSTKASNDMVLLPWIRKHALERLQADRLIVVMNDFIDGATTDLSIELSQKRLRAD